MTEFVIKSVGIVQMDVRQITYNRYVKTVFLVSMETTVRQSVGNVKMVQDVTRLLGYVQTDAEITGLYLIAQTVNRINTVLTVLLTVDIVSTTNRVLWILGTVLVGVWMGGQANTALQWSPTLTNKRNQKSPGLLRYPWF